MLVQLDKSLESSSLARGAAANIKKCAHRGFCNATCPTFVLTKDQALGPRGRIATIKGFLQGEPVTPAIRKQLDLCLACRSCQTTCPAGIEFGQLIKQARALMEQRYPRPFKQRMFRWLVCQTLPYRKRASLVLALARHCQPELKAARSHCASLTSGELPRRTNKTAFSASDDTPTRPCILLLEGCADSLTDSISNHSLIRIANCIGLDARVVKKVGCCASLPQHLGSHAQATQLMKANIDALWPLVKKGAAAIIHTSSSCQLQFIEYPKHMRVEPDYIRRAAHIAKLVKNPAALLNEHIDEIASEEIKAKTATLRIAFHTSCSLRHGLGEHDTVERVLKGLGFSLLDVENSYLCCGSGGTYSVFEPETAAQLRADKLKKLQVDEPDYIVTANTSCQVHLSEKSKVPVVPWLSLVESLLGDRLNH
ncbi:glycolate oxidase subunit GlcF [Aliagarivorans marinus]|uniref:glycolate oxidase subunit GlcF n=1 Tax=Aliagarivorans marinus TaxID=561965 RepID=UPI0003FF9111|nr:glycolate oxidase subunit GlcF [Aliagarivorans marinus]